MRIILLALLALACATPPAEAARRDEQRSAANRVSQPAPARATTRATPPRQATTRQATPPRQATARTAARPATVQRGDVRTQRSGILVRGAAAATVSREAAATCTRRNGRRVCTPARQVSGVAGWQSGLPTASYQQRECPGGTFATLARGHDDVVRCMPM